MPAKLLLLLTFAFWASGFAKLVHEATEHHGRDASSIEDDDDDSVNSALIAIQSVSNAQTAPKPAKSACPICQMLAAMAVCHSTPSFVPTGIGPVIGSVTPPVRTAPPVRISFALSARDPPSTVARFYN